MAFQEAPDPAPGPDDNLIRISSVGICGSDMHAYLGHDERRPAPLILGHEAAGERVVEGPDDRQARDHQPASHMRGLPRVFGGADEPLPDAPDHLHAAARGGRLPRWWRCLPATWVEIPDSVAYDHAAPGRAAGGLLACGPAEP